MNGMHNGVGQGLNGVVKKDLVNGKSATPQMDTATPLREDAFQLSAEDKRELIAEKFREIMHIIGLDLEDDSLNGTPDRVAKMFVNEIFQGLDPAAKPSISLFDNKYQYNEMLVERNIQVRSFCEHHFLPIVGKAHVAYISTGKVIGLSKLNRIVDYFARRPQVQERMTMQIGEELKSVLQTDDVAVLIDADHMCVSMRGIEDHDSSTISSFYSGKFQDANTRLEFFNQLKLRS